MRVLALLTCLWLAAPLGHAQDVANAQGVEKLLFRRLGFVDEVVAGGEAGFVKRRIQARLAFDTNRRTMDKLLSLCRTPPVQNRA